MSSSQGREAATDNQKTMAAAHAAAEICRPSRAFHVLDLVVPGADAPGYESDAPSGLSQTPMSMSHRRGAAKRRQIFSLGREPQDYGAKKNTVSLSHGRGAAKRRQIFSLGREPQGSGKKKEKKPRSGGRHSTVNCRNSPSWKGGRKFRIPNSESYVSGSFRLAEQPGDLVTKWWRALKDPPTKADGRPVGGSFRARHHDVSEPGEAQPERTGNARSEFQIQPAAGKSP